MNKKWIKYVAISFALVLALGIISGIVNGSLALIKAFGFLKNEVEFVSQEDLNFNQSFEGNLDSLIINVSAGNILLQTGDNFNVQGHKVPSNFVAKLENKKLIIQSNPDTTSIFRFLNQDQSSQITITLPNNINLKRVEIEIGAGRITLKNINTDKLILEQGAGEIIATQVNAMEGVLDNGAGSITFKDSQLNNFEINGGVGRIDFHGVLTGNTEINAGVGEIRLEINGNLDDYFIEADSGLGPIKTNGDNIPEDGLGLKSSDNHIDIDGGVGLVNLIFK